MKTLLLNGSYEPMKFIPEKKALKLLVKDKVEVISTWDGLLYGRQKMKLPAILRLKYQVRWIPSKVKFNKYSLFKRDKYTCQYCGLSNLKEEQLTIEHINPKSRGGKLNWINCVSACFPCNNKKKNRTPEEAGMKLLSKPVIPKLNLRLEFELMKHKHDSWSDYLV